jgi:hypothetical protein
VHDHKFKRLNLKFAYVLADWLTSPACPFDLTDLFEAEITASHSFLYLTW